MEGRTGARRAFSAVACCLPLFLIALPYASLHYGIIGALSATSATYAMLILTTSLALKRQFMNKDVSV